MSENGLPPAINSLSCSKERFNGVEPYLETRIGPDQIHRVHDNSLFSGCSRPRIPVSKAGPLTIDPSLPPPHRFASLNGKPILFIFDGAGRLKLGTVKIDACARPCKHKQNMVSKCQIAHGRRNL